MPVGTERSGRFASVSAGVEVAVAAAGLLVLSPILLLIAAIVWIEDGSPILFRQVRIGQHGIGFNLLKFRTMRNRSTRGALLTTSGDSRVTRLGRILRNYKLDELPQLWNVVRGNMRLIGPRPEVPQYVDPADPAWRAVLQVKPGITDLATLVYRNEEQILAGYADVERGYREAVLPTKLILNQEYLKRRSPQLDLKLLFLSLCYSLAPNRFDSRRVRQAILGK